MASTNKTASPSATKVVNNELEPVVSIKVRERDAEPEGWHQSRARFSHWVLYNMMTTQKIMVHPRYQRGLKKQFSDDADEYGWIDMMFKITETRLNIDPKRTDEIAVRWLRGDMMNRELVWNARLTNDYPHPTFVTDANGEGTLKVYGSLVAPDSAHRHLGIYKAVQWSRDSDSIPSTIKIDGKPVVKKDIVGWLKKYKPEETYATVLIYEVKPEEEGRIFHQANDLTKPAGRGAAYDMDRKLSPQ